MAFFDKVKQGLDAASKKTTEVIEVQKINANIRSEKTAIEEIFKKIGQSSFEQYESTGTGDEGFVLLYDSIKSHKASIVEMEKKLDEVRNMKVCPSCQSEQPREVLFCSKCGFRFEDAPVVTPQETSFESDVFPDDEKPQV